MGESSPAPESTAFLLNNLITDVLPDVCGAALPGVQAEPRNSANTLISILQALGDMLKHLRTDLLRRTHQPRASRAG